MGTLVSREMFCVGLSGMLAVRFVLDPSEHLELYLSNTGKMAEDDINCAGLCKASRRSE